MGHTVDEGKYIFGVLQVDIFGGVLCGLDVVCLAGDELQDPGRYGAFEGH